MIVGISGKRGVGKTAASKYLEKKYGYVRVSFADDLRAFAKTFFPFTERDFNQDKEKKYKQYDWSPRDFILHLSELLRYHDSSYWLNRALSRCTDPTKVYVFDDLRFKNEAESIKAQGGKLVRIERYEKLNPYGKNLDIASEKDLDDHKFDFVVHRVRNTSMTELEHQMDAFAGS